MKCGCPILGFRRAVEQIQDESFSSQVIWKRRISQGRKYLPRSVINREGLQSGPSMYLDLFSPRFTRLKFPSSPGFLLSGSNFTPK